MALWTDGEAIDARSLAAVDSSVIKVAASETIVLEGEHSVIRQAWGEAGDTLLEWMQTFAGDLYNWSAGQLGGIFSSQRSRFLLNQVVTTGQYGSKTTPLVTYVTHYAMTLLWKQAARRTDKDRYLGKLGEAQEDLKKARRRLWSNGIPIVRLPLSAPGALFDPLAGIWGASNVVVDGTEDTDPQSYDVAITYVDGTVYVNPAIKGNGESGPSAPITVTMFAGQSLTIDIASLTPPGTIAYQGGTADGIRYARSASGWNVYAGLTGSPLVLQNSPPLPLSALSYVIVTAAAIVTSGPLLGPGQYPDINERPRRLLAVG